MARTLETLKAIRMAILALQDETDKIASDVNYAVNIVNHFFAGGVMHFPDDVRLTFGGTPLAYDAWIEHDTAAAPDQLLIQNQTAGEDIVVMATATGNIGLCAQTPVDRVTIGGDVATTEAELGAILMEDINGVDAARMAWHKGNNNNRGGLELEVFQNAVMTSAIFIGWNTHMAFGGGHGYTPAALPGPTMTMVDTDNFYLNLVADVDADSADTDCLIRFYADGVPGTGTLYGFIGYDQGDGDIEIGYGNTAAIYIDSNEWVGIGVSPVNAHLHIEDQTLAPTTGYYGTYSLHIITDASSLTEANDITGLFVSAQLNDSDDTIGFLIAVNGQAVLTDGTIGDGQEDVRGGNFASTINGGTVAQDVYGEHSVGRIAGGTISGDLYGGYFQCDGNGGTISTDVIGVDVIVDIESAMTSIGGSIYGVRVDVDDDQGAVGTVYMLYLNEQTGIDYGVYQNGSALNCFGGDVAPLASGGSSLGTTSLEWANLYLADNSVIYFGDDQDVTLTHIPDTGVRLADDISMLFGNSSDGDIDYDSASNEFHITAGGGGASTDIRLRCICSTANIYLDPAAGAVIISSNVHILSNDELRFYDNGNYVGFEAPALAADQIWVLPTADGAAGTVLRTDGAGTLSWAAAGAIAAPGADTQVIYNAGGVLAAEAAFTYDYNNNILTADSIRATVDCSPNAPAGATLGTTALEWSDLYIADSGVIYLGDDQDVTLTHVADTGILLNSTRQFQFRDAAIYIASLTDGHMDLAADTSVDFNTPVIDLSNQTVDVTLNAAVDALNFDSNTLSIDAANNRVGVNNAAPVGRFHVVHDLANGIRGDRTTAAIVGIVQTASFNVITSGDMIAGLGVSFELGGQDDTSALSTWGSLTALRGTADNSGEFIFETVNAGVYNEGFRITEDSHCQINNDSKRLTWGANQDAYIEFDGNSMNIVGNAGTAGDDILMTAGSVWIDAADLSPSAVGGATLGTAELEWADAYFEDGSIIYFGDNQDVTLTHVADVGLTLNLHLGIGATANALYHLYVYDNALNITTDYYGVYAYHQKTAGATDQNDNMTGGWFEMVVNDTDSTVGSIRGLYAQGHLVDGTVGTGTSDVFGIQAQAQIDAGTAGDDVYAVWGRSKIDGGTVSGDAYGAYFANDIDAAVTAITGNAYGVFILLDCDTDPGGTAYALYINDATNVDYGIYQAGSSLNVFGGHVAPLASGGSTLGTTSLEWADLYLADGGRILFGDDQDVTLTHVADTGLLLNAAMQLQFRDAALLIYSSADGQLDIDADTQLEMTSPTVQIVASTEIDLDTNVVDIGTGADTDITLNFIANTSSGVLKWMEDEDEFQFDDDVFLPSEIELWLGQTGGTYRGSLYFNDASNELKITSAGGADYPSHIRLACTGTCSESNIYLDPNINGHVIIKSGYDLRLGRAVAAGSVSADGTIRIEDSAGTAIYLLYSTTAAT